MALPPLQARQLGPLDHRALPWLWAAAVNRLHDGGARLAAVRKRMKAEIRPLTCRRCGEAIDPSLSGLHPLGLHVGHILAVADGGSDAWANLAPEHNRCNVRANRRARVASTFATIVVPVFSGTAPRWRRVPTRGMVPDQDYLRDDATDRDG